MWYLSMFISHFVKTTVIHCFGIIHVPWHHLFLITGQSSSCYHELLCLENVGLCYSRALFINITVFKKFIPSTSLLYAEWKRNECTFGSLIVWCVWGWLRWQDQSAKNSCSIFFYVMQACTKDTDEILKKKNKKELLLML